MTAFVGFFVVFTVAVVQVSSQKLSVQNFTSEWVVATENSSFLPLVADYRNRLVFVSFPSDTSIKLETSKFVNKPCIVKTKFDLENLWAPLNVVALENGKLVVIFAESKRDASDTNVWLYAIDPHECSYDLDRFTLDAGLDDVSSVFDVVPYVDSFDIFVRSDRYCVNGSICSLRYNDKLALVSKKSPSIPQDGDSWGMISVKDYDPSKGYVLVSTASERAYMKIKRFDQNFNLVNQAQFNQSGVVSYWYNEDFSSGMCIGISDQELKCVLLDSLMRVRVQKILRYEQNIQAYTTIRLENGGALVFTALSDDPEGSDSIVYVRILDRDGRSSKLIKFQEYICDSFEMNTFRSLDGLHCNYVICSNIVNVRCISSAENRVF